MALSGEDEQSVGKDERHLVVRWNQSELFDSHALWVEVSQSSVSVIG